MKPIRLGIVGAAGRGAAFKLACDLTGLFVVHALCDTRAEGLARARQEFGDCSTFSSYDQLLERGEVEAILIATPMPLHAPQAIAALQRNIHVLSEVPAAVSIAECEQLVRVATASSACYMMAENYCYRKPAVLIEQLVRQGYFGEPYYGRGEYLHELKELNEQTPWRRRWQTGVNGITYPTHSLGPILRWFGGDRVTSVCYSGSGHHHRDAAGRAYELEDTGVMLARTEQQRLITIRVDMLSDRPHAMHNYELQGTEGVYESARDGSEEGAVWFKKGASATPAWRPLRDFEALLPDHYRNAPSGVAAAGHGGGDYWVLREFGEAILNRRPSSIGIHEAMDMTLPGLVSQLSAGQGGGWMTVPDSRAWLKEAEAPVAQLQMAYPVAEARAAPVVVVPSGYLLRQLNPSDHEAYLALMVKAGFADWAGNNSRLNWVQSTVLPGGFFVVEHQASGSLVATALATHSPDPLHPQGGELGWVAADPAHAGRGLGWAVTAAALRRFLDAGYQRIYLRTDDHRLPAIALYRKLGFRPYLFRDDMAPRWSDVEKKLERNTP